MTAISRSSEHAIRALTYLAQESGTGGYHLAREMAERLGIPAPFLGKLLPPLVVRGILHSQRGRNGGFRLARAADEIALLEVVDALEPMSGARRCVLGQVHCSDERACPLHDTWQSVFEGFRDRLRSTTLADVLRHCSRRPTSGYPVATPSQPPSRRRPAALKPHRTGGGRSRPRP